MKLTIIEKTTPSGSAQHDDITLIFDAGMGNWSLFFKPLAEKLRSHYRICLIDRTGYDEMLPCQTEHDALNIAMQMKSAIDKHDLKGKLVVAGHSIGGLHVRMFHLLFPLDVVGIILIDPAHPALFEFLPGLEEVIDKQHRYISSLITIARTGVLRLVKNRIPTFDLPAELHHEYYQLTTRQKYYHTYAREMEALKTTVRQSAVLPARVDIPVLVVASTAGLNAPDQQDYNRNYNPIWRRMQRTLYHLSRNCTFIECYGGHFPHLTSTDQVAGAILNFIKPITYAKSS